MKTVASVVELLLLLSLSNCCANASRVSQPSDVGNRLFELSRGYYRSGKAHLEKKEYYSAAKNLLLAAELNITFEDAWDRYLPLEPILSGDSSAWGEDVPFPPHVPSDALMLVRYEVGRKLMEMGKYKRAKIIFAFFLELCDRLPPPYEQWKPYLKSAIEECDGHIDSEHEGE